jgi:hypothetical protein
VRREDDIDQARMAYGPDVMACQTIDRMKSREEQLTWAKQRALICVDMGRFSDAVAGLRADLAENPLTKGVISSETQCADTKRRWTRRSAGARKR